MKVYGAHPGLFGVVLSAGLAWAAPAEAAPKVDFNREIRPLLSDNCFACHGPDANKVQSKLRLDQRESATKPAKSGSIAIVPGQPARSELVRRIRAAAAEDRMPPPESHKTLTPAQKRLLERWVAEGAVYSGHWAYTLPLRPPVPSGANAIDYLVQRHLREVRLRPSGEADRRTLARRLHFDLIGLPASAEAVAAFESEAGPGAYERLVDQLMASPHFGERMATGWLDVVRFADTIGYHSDNPRNIWPYRDYVIRSFNENTPFDQFTREQLAGDLFPSPTLQQQVATGFNRLLLTTEEGGAQPKDYESRHLTDRVRALGTVWLGQTIGCAQCHDHKFDPFTTRDFYSLGAFFADIKEAAIGRREDGMWVASEAQARALARHEETVARWQQECDRLKEPAPELVAARTQLDAAKKAQAEFEATVPRTLIVQRIDPPRRVRVLPRGDWMSESGEVVEPALPRVFAATPAGGARLNRLDLANWLVSREQPLTGRVFMNRLWKQFFGIGLSKIPEDLGAQGETPPNQPLLDWLACEFMDSGWDIKHMVRLIVTSRTYRQTSVPTRRLLERDPDNRALARQGRWRLEAELLRDNSLAVPGLLDLTVGGPSVKPYQPDGYWENLNFPKRTYEASQGTSQYRRGLYTWWQRSFPHPSLVAFDAPSREECVAERSRSNIPQQALVLLNDPTYVEAARVFAARILRECRGDDSERLRWAWRQTLARTPDREELRTLRALLEKHRGEYRQEPAAAYASLKVGASPLPAGVDGTHRTAELAAELAAWSNVARTLLNLHETITRP